MITKIVNLPAAACNPTVVACSKMNHHRCAAFVKCKHTITTTTRKFSGSVVVQFMKKGHAIEFGDDDEDDTEKPNRIYGGHFDGKDTGMLIYIVLTSQLGSKFELALETGMDDTIGIDLVAMILNDLVTVGPSTHLHIYYAMDARFSEKVINCMADACRSTCIFSEAATLPGITGAVAKVNSSSVIDGKNIEVGDVLIGLPSSGIHSSGFPLVRRVLEHSGCSLKHNLPGMNITLGESLMTPTVIYKNQVCEIISKGGVKGIAQIAGGGLTGNVTRAFPLGLGAIIFQDSWVVPPIFKWIQEEGRIEDIEMRRTFNMGIGMVLVMSKEGAYPILEEPKIEAYYIGEVVSGNGVMYQKG